MFEHKGTAYDNISVTFEDWGVRKQSNDTGEFGGLPIVHDQGSPALGMQQLSALLRSYGLKFGYYPENNQDNWALCGKIDEIVYTWADVLNAFAPLLG